MRPHVLLAFPVALAALAPDGRAADSTIYDIPGSAPGVQLGVAVASTGDVDGDGVDDFAAGSPEAAGGLGTARVVSGVNGVVVRNFQGSTHDGRFGAALGSADVTGDGRPDVLVGAPLAGLSGEGTVTAFDSLSGQPVWVLFGQGPDDQFGFAIQGLGDLNADGIEDVAIGAVFDDDGAANAGSVRVVSGYDGATLYTAHGSRPDEHFGYALCALDDLDGDGRRELAVGAPSVVVAASNQPGSVLVLSGATGLALFKVVGEAGGDAFGRALACLDDLDGDGFGDLLIGAPRPLGDPEGYARVVSGLAGTTLLQVAGEQGELFGASVAAAGDVDGDGVGDFAVGSPRDGGTGLDAGSVSFWSGENGTELARVEGELAGTFLGAALSGPLDCNQDEVSDVIVGAPELGLTGGAGRARLVSSNDLALAADLHLISIAAPGPQALSLDAGAAFAGTAFALLGSVSGNHPGTTIGGLPVPLNADRYFGLTLKLLPGGPLQPPTGTLDSQGRASATFELPPSAPFAALVGITFHHAFVLHDGAGGVLFASNAVPVTITL